jgi:hypothetical protein
MKRQSSVLLAVAFVTAGAAGCFKDPVSDLLSGPSALSVNHSIVFVHAGDSTSVAATLKDKGGNFLDVGTPSWSVVDPSVASVRLDTSLVIPGNSASHAVIKGVDSVGGGWTYVIVTARGVTDTVRVVDIPKKLVSQHVTTAGPSLTDTVIVPASILPPAPAKFNQYTAKDTLVLSGTSTLTFDTSKVTVQVATTNGASKGFIVAKTPTQLKVVFQVGTAGKVMVQHLLMTPGNPAVGTVVVDTLIGDSVAVAPWRIGPAAFGASAAVASNILTVTAGPNMSFTAATTANLGANAGIIIGQTAGSLSMFSPVNYNGSVTVFKVTMAGGPGVPSIVFDSLTSTVGALGALSPAVFPNANITMSPNNARLGDTIILAAPAGLAFTASSRALVGNQGISTSDTAWVISQTAATMKVFAKRGGSSNVKVTNLQLASGGLPFTLTSPSAVAIDTVATDFPAATTKATARVAVIPASNVDTVYGSVNCSLSGCQQPPNGVTTNDMWTFTTAATQIISVSLRWYGTGNPYSGSDVAHTADLDIIACTAAMTCGIGEADDILTGGAASNQPENGVSAAQPAGQYYLNVIPFTGPQTVVYRLIITLQ